MVTLLGGFFALFLGWSVLRWFAGADPVRMARVAKLAGGAAALLAGALLVLRGRLDMGLLVAGAGAWLLGWSASPLARGRDIFTRRVSRMRSATLAMELDGRSGRLAGRVLDGPLAGRDLDGLDRPELLRLLRETLARDPDGAGLLAAYLDRRFPGWREDAEADPDGRRRPDPKRGAMSEEEAYQVLGLQPGADPEAIRAAHRSLMKRLHPDGGGSTYLASRVNQAKDALLDRHR